MLYMSFYISQYYRELTLPMLSTQSPVPMFSTQSSDRVGAHGGLPRNVALNHGVTVLVCIPNSNPSAVLVSFFKYNTNFYKYNKTNHVSKLTIIRSWMVVRGHRSRSPAQRSSQWHHRERSSREMYSKSGHDRAHDREEAL